MYFNNSLRLVTFSCLQGFAADRLDGDRHVLDVFRAARRRHDDFLNAQCFGRGGRIRSQGLWGKNRRGAARTQNGQYCATY